MKIHGVVQPITVRKVGTNKYQLISGERRTPFQTGRIKRNSCLCARGKRPGNAQIALIENIQREDLNAIEVAIHFRRLLDECNLTHETLADRVGKGPFNSYQFLRLLKLPPEMQRGLKRKKYPWVMLALS
ncbi:MAG: ParB/RepB/Spo0J family partition protein [Bacteroidetes bacterium]|nr:ParB/RepB/Spo0J family partition protein [Bacteroidota bacterium]